MRGFLLPHLLTEAAERFPHRVAVKDDAGELRYAELERRANRLAHALREAGVSRGDRVGLLLNKSIDAIVGIYGILKMGAAYVPLDPFAPAPRLAYITRDCGVRCLVTQREKSQEWRLLAEAGAPLEHLVVMNAEASELGEPPKGVRTLDRRALDAAPGEWPGVPGIDLDLAYILYTSGSTGQPKGVMLSHLNALAYVTWCYDYFGPRSEDVFSNHAPLHFDLTILDIYTAAMAGATLAIVPPDVSVFPLQLASFIEDRRITIWYSVPSVLTMLVLRGNLTVGRLPSLRHVIFAGEVFPTKHLRALMKLLPHAQFTNLYGPTETNVCTYYRVPILPEAQTEPIPIGKPIDNVEVVAVTEAGPPAADGEVGELYVRGNTVAAGYWGDAERTARSFLANPFSPAQDRTYRTGDLVRRAADGNFIFIGRGDHQIKSRGYRIELGDVEAALAAHPRVEECAVVAIPDEVVGNRLKAFVVANDPGLKEGDLVKFCAERLPKYMIPEFFEFVTSLPKTSTGKIDRRVLGTPAVLSRDQA